MRRRTCPLLILGIIALFSCASSASEVQTASVRYLGGNGWVIAIEQRMLIFDYRDDGDPNPPRWSDRNLETGYPSVADFAGYDVYVFVTHSHFDHYDDVIFQWERGHDAVTYLFGWEAGSNPEHLYFDELRESAEVEGMNVYTIDSHHNDVPEVAFLVVVDGWTIYFNGDYRSDYEADYAYLASITDRIDLAFVIGHPFETHQYFQQVLRLTELFDVSTIFPMNREGEESRCHEYADLLTANGVDADIPVADRRGDLFPVEKPADESP